MINNQTISGEFDSQLSIDLCSITTIDEINNSFGLNIYPNPSSGFVNIQSSSYIESIKIYDILGKIVLSKSCNIKLEQLNLQLLTKGTYTIQINTSGHTHHKKIILQ